GAWSALLVCVLAIGAALVWGLSATAPVKVSSQGVMLAAGGLVDIRASEAGRLTTLLLEPGTRVSRGELVARLAQPELARELANAEGRLQAARDRHARLQRFFDESRAREQQADAERLQTVRQTTALLEERLALLENKLANVRKLISTRALARDELIDVHIEVSDTRERIALLDDEAAEIRLRRLDKDSERRIQLLDQGLVVDDLERERLRLAELLQSRSEVRSPYTGQVVEVKVNAGDVLTPATALATVAPDDGADPAAGAGELYGLLYVPPTEGKRVREGMRVEVAPSTVRREEYGYMHGEVVSIAPLPASLEGMRRRLQNDQLVRQLSGSGAPFEARVRLRRDPATPSGFAWSSSRGPDTAINAGTLFEGRVIVRRVRLLSLLAPQLEQLLGGDDGG
ncbi:MAG: NHLP bacteriocin system secretion protein, partial [Gammaproteobacteria bacterium]|nr:NHLP bacteriocin system secretion protein [Gammaproteobacteria bacterium]